MTDHRVRPRGASAGHPISGKEPGREHPVDPGTVVSGAQSTYMPEDTDAKIEISKMQATPAANPVLTGKGLTHGQQLLMNVLFAVTDMGLFHYDEPNAPASDVPNPDAPTRRV